MNIIALGVKYFIAIGSIVGFLPISVGILHIIGHYANVKLDSNNSHLKFGISLTLSGLLMECICFIVRTFFTALKSL